LASLQQMTGYLFYAHLDWQSQQAKTIAPESHFGEYAAGSSLMEFVRDCTEPPSPEFIHGLATSASQGHRSGNQTAEFSVTDQPPGTSKEELFGVTATTAALPCDYLVWQSQQAEITAPHAHSEGQSHEG